MGLADDRRQMMLAMRFKRNITENDNLVVACDFFKCPV